MLSVWDHILGYRHNIDQYSLIITYSDFLWQWFIYLFFTKLSEISYEHYSYNLNCFDHHNRLCSLSDFVTVFGN